MSARSLIAVLALLALAACDRAAAPTEAVSDAPQLEAPAPDAEPSRSFAPANEAATALSGELALSMAMRMPDADDADRGAAPQETLTLRGANGLIVEAELAGAVTPATQVEGQTLRALLGIPVEAPQVLIYRVTHETKPESGQGLCGAGAPASVVVWEPEGPGEAVLKVLGVSGAAPGQAGARACTLLDYRRS